MAIPVQNKAWLLVFPALIVVLLTAGVPLMTMVNYSVQDVFSGDQFFWVGAEWFEQTLMSTDFQGSLGRSLAYCAIVLLIEVPLGLFIALRMPDKGALANAYVVLMTIPLLTPSIVVGFVWKLLADTQAGLLGVSAGWLGIPFDMQNPVFAWSTIVLMDVWHWTSLITLLCYAGLQAIPVAYYQAAAIDGANRRDVFRFVQLPRIRRVLMIAILLRFMDSFMVYTEPYVVTRGGPGTSTTLFSIDLVQTASIQFDLGEAGAMSLIYFLIIVLVSWSLFTVMMAREDRRDEA